jgi:hypothetical protein
MGFTFHKVFFPVNYPPTQSDGMGFKPNYECKEQYIVDFSGMFTDTVQSNLRKTTYVLLFVLGTVFSQDEPIHDI